MTNGKIQTLISDNQFAFNARVNHRFDKAEFDELVRLLTELRAVLKEEQLIDKAFALDLYCISQGILWSWFAFKDDPDCEQLSEAMSDAWFEVDELITACLSEQA
jgi:hypothetical protein